MRRRLSTGLWILILTALMGCETAKGVTADIANTARNIRDILGVGRDIGNMTK